MSDSTCCESSLLMSSVCSCYSSSSVAKGPFPPSEQKTWALKNDRIFCYVHFWLGGLVAEALRANCSLSCATGPSPFAPDTDSGKADSMWKWRSFLNMVYWLVRSCRQNKKGWQPELCRLTCWLTKVYFTHCDDLLLVMPVSYCFHVLFMCELTL